MGYSLSKKFITNTAVANIDVKTALNAEMMSLSESLNHSQNTGKYIFVRKEEAEAFYDKFGDCILRAWVGTNPVTGASVQKVEIVKPNKDTAEVRLFGVKDEDGTTELVEFEKPLKNFQMGVCTSDGKIVTKYDPIQRKNVMCIYANIKLSRDAKPQAK